VETRVFWCEVICELYLFAKVTLDKNDRHSRITPVLTRIARIALRAGLALTSVALLLVALVTGWVFFYASDLPDIQTLS